MVKRIRDAISQHQEFVNLMLQDEVLQQKIQEVSECCIECLQNGHKILLCGNGGSASDAQHIAAELSGRYLIDRPPLFAEALHVNTSYLTAVANDYNFDHVYARAVEAKGFQGDVLIALSTSGKSPNVLKAVQVAKDRGLITVGMTGRGNNPLLNLSNFHIAIPSDYTPNIQEGHIMVGHILCEIIEATIFGASNKD